MGNAQIMTGGTNLFEPLLLALLKNWMLGSAICLALGFVDGVRKHGWALLLIVLVLIFGLVEDHLLVIVYAIIVPVAAVTYLAGHITGVIFRRLAL